MPARQPTDEPIADRGLLWGSAPRALIAVLVLAGCAALVAGWATGGDGDAEQVPLTAAGPAVYEGLEYVVLGDSLGRGVQADPQRTLKGGYARDLLEMARGEYSDVRFTEAACGGATSGSFITGGKECMPDVAVPYRNADPRTSQLAWAKQYLRARGDRPTLVTLTIGGNDVIACLQTEAAPLRRCLEDDFPELRRNWERIATELRDAAGPRTVLAVATIYDPGLAAVRIQGGIFAPAARAFHRFMIGDVNPALREVFGDAGWSVADMGDAVYERDRVGGPQSRPVRAVCDLTWACDRVDVHLNDEGYAVLADVFRGAVEEPLRRAVGR